MTPEQRAARAERWRQFYEEDGGIGEMLARLTAEMTGAAIEGVDGARTQEQERRALANAAHGLRVVSSLNDAIKRIIADGKVAEHSVAVANRLAQLPERKRRWL